MNAHSHLMAMTLSTSEVIPVVKGKKIQRQIGRQILQQTANY
jgi:thiamine phosphate synthase YjbQ (UPF0047 family)